MLSITRASISFLCVPCLVPLPGAGDDLVQVFKLLLPSQLGLDLLRARFQHRRIAWASRAFLYRNGPSRHAAHGLDHLKNSKPLSVANVVDQTAAVFAQRS